jgi:hypothetical protein
LIDHFPRLKSTLKDLPFLILAAIIARILKDMLVSRLGLYYNFLLDDYDPVKMAVNWVLLAFFFFAILYLRHRWGRRE